MRWNHKKVNMQLMQIKLKNTKKKHFEQVPPAFFHQQTFTFEYYIKTARVVVDGTSIKPLSISRTSRPRSEPQD